MNKRIIITLLSVLLAVASVSAKSKVEWQGNYYDGIFSAYYDENCTVTESFLNNKKGDYNGQAQFLVSLALSLIQEVNMGTVYVEGEYQMWYTFDYSTEVTTVVLRNVLTGDTDVAKFSYEE